MCLRLLGGSVDRSSFREGVEREGDKYGCMLCVGPSFPMHTPLGPWAPWAMSKRSVMCVNDGLVDRPSVQEGV